MDALDERVRDAELVVYEYFDNMIAKSG